MTMWLHAAISDLLYSFYDGSSDGAVQPEITDVTKMDSVSAKDRADAIPEALMPPEKDPFGIVTEMFEVVIDMDYTISTLLLLQTENLDLKLTPYKVLATSTKHGFLQFIESTAVAEVLATDGAILNFFRKHAPSESAPYGVLPEVIDTYVKSCAMRSQLCQSCEIQSAYRSSQGEPFLRMCGKRADCLGLERGYPQDNPAGQIVVHSSLIGVPTIKSLGASMRESVSSTSQVKSIQ
ncbi:hypothetical protein LSAT2_023256 [Lamellibrachia satsuma]|nr:hypothetical protein LSAT2_023256 [Lamellibrachia satsuma]